MSEELIEAIIQINGRERQVDTGNYLFHQADPVKSIFVIRQGLIELTRFQHEGGSITLQRASSNTVLAEASAYSRHYHCDAIAVLPSIVYRVSKSAFLRKISIDYSFSNLWTTHLANEVQNARYRSEILSRKTVAARLDGWLAWRGVLPAKGHWKDVASQIGVTPEALYRELAKRT